MRSRIIAFVFCLLFSHSAFAVLAIDGAISTVFSGSCAPPTPCTMTFSNSLTNDVLIMTSIGPTSNITGITDSAGLTWHFRKVVTVATNNLEIWYAVSSGVLTSDTISVVYGATGFSPRLTVFGINGANLTTPFDPNGSLPASATGTTATTLTNTISTNSANDMLLAWVRSSASLGTVTEPSGFSQIVNTGAGADQSSKIVSSIQTSLGVVYSWSGATTASGMVVDAVQQAGGAAPANLDLAFPASP